MELAKYLIRDKKTHSFSGKSTWKQMTSPSWISLWLKVNLAFMTSIIPGLISYVFARYKDIRSNKTNRYLEKFQRSSRCPAHSFVNDRDEIPNLIRFGHIYLSSTEEGLFRRIIVLKEYHNRLRRNIRLAVN